MNYDNLEKISIDKIAITDSIFSTIYIKRNDKFMPIVIIGSSFSEEARDKLKSKNIIDVYIDKADIKLDSNTKVSKNNLPTDEEVDENTKSLYNATSEILDNLFNSPSTETISLTKNIANNMMDEMLSDDRVFNSLLKVTTHDYYTYTHSINVSVYAMGLGKYIGLSSSDLKLLSESAILHDIGKSEIDSDIINKKGKLTDSEFKIIQTHPQLGYDIVKNQDNMNEKVLKGIIQHHERYDGTGYPNRLKGSKIHIFAKIILVADIFDALTTKRSYKFPMSTYDAFNIMKNEMAGHFDIRLLNKFITLMNAK